MFSDMPKVEDNVTVNAAHGMRLSNFMSISSFAIAHIGIDSEQN
jgi:hypothetical protein